MSNNVNNKFHRDQYKHLMVIAASFVLVIIQVILFLVVLAFYYNHYTEWPLIRKQTVANLGFYIIFIIAFTRATGGYKVGYLRIHEVCIAQAIAIVIANFVEYFELCLYLGRFVFVWPMLLLTIVELPIEVIWSYTVRRKYLAMYPAHQMLFLYGDRIQNELIEKMAARDDKFVIEESISVKDYTFNELKEIIVKYKSVVIADIPTEMRNDVLKFCYGQDIRTYTTPKISDILLGGEEKIHMFDTPLLLGRNYGLTAEHRILKRVMDVVVSGVTLLLLSPVVLIVASLIKITDKGTVFFKQTRFSRNGEPFKIYKFRTMREYRGVDEDRVTEIGRFLRRTHLDEIPQLLNVFKGEMSLVGPRPLVPKDYENDIPEFVFRLKVKPGMTGYAQVYGSHVTTEYDKLKLDLFYISNYSMIMDIKLLLMTMRVVWKMDRKEEVENSKE